MTGSKLLFLHGWKMFLNYHMLSEKTPVVNNDAS